MIFELLTLHKAEMPHVLGGWWQWLQTLTNAALMSSLLLGFRASRLAVTAFAASMRCASSLS